MCGSLSRPASCASRIPNSLAASRIEATWRGACRLGPAGCGRRCGGNRGGSGSARRPPDRWHATPCASGGWRCRCGGRPAGYWDHGAPTPRPTANRLRIGRSSAAYWAFIGRLLTVKAHASALRTSRRRSRTRSCGATSRSRKPTRILWWGTSHRMLSRFRPASRHAPRSSSRCGSSPPVR